MDSVSLTQICDAVDGSLIQGDPRTTVDHVSTDSRTIAPGSLFIALMGERFDGHAYVGRAVSAGAAALMVQSPVKTPENAACIRVTDTLSGLKNLAAWYRGRYDIPLIAVTGSTGKTSTKEMIAAMLGAKYNTHKNIGNFNNEIGLSHTLLALDHGHEASVVEMGMNHAGEISVLSRMAKPGAAVITNIGLSHIGNLGSQENILAAKLEILEGMRKDAPLVINGEDALLTGAAREMDRPVIRCGFSEGYEVRAVDVRMRGEQGSVFTAVTADAACGITLNSPGRHSIQNCLCALGAALSAGLTLAEAAEGLKDLAAARMRLAVETTDSGTKIINDAYNASPDSVSAALAVLMEMDARRHYAVLGDMLEMGEYAKEAHYETGQKAAKSGIDGLVAIGEWSRHTVRGARDAGMDGAKVYHCMEHAEAITYLQGVLGPEDALLVKGSRGMKLERIVDAVLNRQEEV